MPFRLAFICISNTFLVVRIFGLQLPDKSNRFQIGFVTRCFLCCFNIYFISAALLNALIVFSAQSHSFFIKTTAVSTQILGR